MNVSCPQCSTTYRVDPAKVPQGGVRARCSSCGGVIPVGMSAEVSTRKTPVAVQPRTPTPPRPVTPVRPMTPARPVTPVREAPPMRETTPPRGATLPPLRPTPRTAWPSVATPSAPAPLVESTPAPPPPRAATPHAARPFVPSQTPISVPAYTPPPPAPPTPPPVSGTGYELHDTGYDEPDTGYELPGTSTSSPASIEAPTEVSPPPPPVRPTTPPERGERRPINPFLARDPSLRAKRLARALVSDMVAYYPAKHSEGLQKGTLKELFRDEIKKSYEEYVAQVGADFARTTNYFQEALNEVLGAGKRIF